MVTALAWPKPLPFMVNMVPAVPLAGDMAPISGMMLKPAAVPVPPGEVIAIFPELPRPTTAVICVEDTTVNEAAGRPPKVTEVAPVKFVPVIVMVVPAVAEAGEKEVMTGPGINVNPPFSAKLNCEYTLTLPVAPAPTTAVMVVDDTTLTDAAPTPPKLTPETSSKFAPVMVTTSPALAVAGVKLFTMICGWKYTYCVSVSR